MALWLCNNRRASRTRNQTSKNSMRRFHRVLSLLLVSCFSAGCSSSASTALSDSPSNTVISANVAATLAEDHLGGLGDILVATDGGTVTLTGTVQKAERKARAAELARQVKGVKRVKNNIQIHADVSP